jgi:hypothetical protein
MEISSVKTKIMAFQRKDPIDNKIHIYNKVIEQVICSKCLSCYMTYENERH